MRWVRWALVLPAAVAGAIVAQAAVIVITIFVPWPEVSRIVSSFAMPLAFVALGSRVAPSQRVRVAGILTVIMLVLHGMFWGVSLFSGWYTGSQILEHSGAFTAGIVGTILGLFFAYRRERRLSQLVWGKSRQQHFERSLLPNVSQEEVHGED